MANPFLNPSTITMIQATYYDNGKPVKPAPKKSNGERSKNKPQHMVALSVWDNPSIELRKPDFTTSIIMIPHYAFTKRVDTWLEKGSISPVYANGLKNLHAAVADPFMQDRTFFGPLYEMGMGQRYIDDQCMVATIEMGMVQSALLYTGTTTFNLSHWDTKYPDGSPLADKAKSMVRFDAGNYFHKAWRTCP